MTEESKQDYEKRLNRARAEVVARMLQVPEVQAAISDRAMITLCCPRGHKLFPAVLEMWDDGRDVMVRPLDDHGGKSRTTARGSRFTRTSSVCLEPGCPRIAKDGPGRCDEHGGPAVDVDMLATRFACRLASCGWGERVNTARLLQVITAALVARQTTVPITGTPARRNRR